MTFTLQAHDWLRYLPKYDVIKAGSVMRLGCHRNAGCPPDPRPLGSVSTSEPFVLSLLFLFYGSLECFLFSLYRLSSSITSCLCLLVSLLTSSLSPILSPSLCPHLFPSLHSVPFSHTLNLQSGHGSQSHL